MNMLTIAFQLLVSLLCLLAAIIITFRPVQWSTLIKLFPLRQIKRIVLAVLLWISFIVTIISLVAPFTAFFGSCFSFVSSIPLVLGAIHSKAPRTWILPLVMAVSSVSLGIVQPLGLKVLCLPKADDLSYRPVNAKLIKTYDEGFGFEGIAAGRDGTLYLSGNRGLDFSRGDYYQKAQGELIARNPDGIEHIVFRTPLGITSGVPVVVQDNSIYLTGHGIRSFIWHIEANGKARQLAEFPAGAWPNGLDMGPDGMLYAPDSNLGIIWRINPGSGQIEVALRDNALLARKFISLAPGANGLHFKDQEMLVTVSDRTTILSYKLDEQGHFGKAVILAKGIPGDDFAIGADGSLFITTHPYNTVVSVSPKGERIIIGNADQHIVGATDAAFGKTIKDQHVLYVVTDGGAFTDGPKTRGQLVALEPYQ